MQSERAKKHLVKTILGMEIPVDSADDNGKTALMEACDCGNNGMRNLLISRGANQQALDNDGRSIEYYKERPFWVP